MGADSKIEWTDHTFNPWWGCQRVSPGCEHCYAEAFDHRLGGDHWGPTAARKMASEKYWAQPVAWDRAAARTGHRASVFCASMADVFEDRPDLREPRARLHRLIADTPRLIWLLLTKRPENADRLWSDAHYDAFNGADSLGPTWAPNAWLGTTVEDQRRADERIPKLLSAPAARRFLSCEPLLGHLDLRLWFDEPRTGLIDWVIVGGESGPGARPIMGTWVRHIRNQCGDADVPFFFKQWGGRDKKAAGAELDGREWRESPNAR